MEISQVSAVRSETPSFKSLSDTRDFLKKSHTALEVTSLQDLIAKLHKEFENDEVNVDHVYDLMRSYKSNPQEWRKFAKFDRYRYTRNLVDAGNGKFNLMVLCWGEGHGSAIHDHADAHCFMKMLQGTLNETRFAWPEEEKEERRSLQEIGKSQIETDDVCYINDSLGLHRVENPSHINPAVSLHLYCPPFDNCSVFNQQTGQRTKSMVTFYSKFGERKGEHEGKAPEDN
ncbi:UNVERIFIED_CONTAM: hypothetical protein PYX00_002582 [Menopon gallinae]|uniref:Cysteine dioxygenase n=1 Tax=Menopon gallinae TaxID=328185 RepID=A0AAW2IJB6_9NEOP